MRILMQNRSDAFSQIGGDTIQMLKTKEYLEKLGVEVDISLDLKVDLERYDIVHLFNISRVDETWLQYKNAKKQGKKVVCSTIYHSKRQIKEYEENGLVGFSKILGKINRHENMAQLIRTIVRNRNTRATAYQMIKGYSKQQLEILLGSDVILPNSRMELNEILIEFNLKENDVNYGIVTNAVDINKSFDEIDEMKFIDKYRLENFILCVGRVEPLKNQLGLIEALNSWNIDIVFIGDLNKKHKKYINKFMNKVEKNNRLHYLGKLEQEELFAAYKCSKVTVLPSWFETTGLVGLEAINMGSKVVITEKGYTKNYYLDYVEYCKPNDKKSINDAVDRSLKSNKSIDELKKLIKTDYNWGNCANQMCEIYKNLIELD